MALESRQQLTLVLVIQHQKVLLGLKKTGFGAGRWNALGGKIEEGEEALKGALRELEEECGLRAEKGEEVARILVDYLHTGRKVEIHVFRVEDVEGTVQETGEMDVHWIPIEEVPYEKMWANDQYWLPYVLNGKIVQAHFVFRDEETVLEKQVEILP